MAAGPLGIPLALRALPWAAPLVAGISSYALARLISWIDLRGLRALLASDPNPHWSARARLAWAPRARAAVLIFVCPLIGYFVGEGLTGAEAWPASPAIPGVSAVAAFFAALASARALGATLGLPRSTFGRDFASFAFGLLGLASFALAVGAAYALGTGIAERSAMPLALGATAAIVAAARIPRRLMLLAGVLRPSPELARRFEPIFAHVGVRPEAVETLDATMANAFAFPLERRIVITTRLLELLTEPELDAIVAHEAGHLTEGRLARIRVLPLYVLVSFGFFLGLVSSRYVLVVEVVHLIALVVSLVVLRRFSVRLEARADHAATDTVDGPVYARALARIHEANLLPAVVTGGSHPSLYDRMLAAGVTPDFPRPEPPGRRGTFGIALVLFVVLVTSFALPFLLRADAQSSRTALMVQAVLFDGAWSLGELGRRSEIEDDLRGADAWYAEAERIDPRSTWYPTARARVAAFAGRCVEARAALARALARGDRSEEDDGAIDEAESYVDECVDRRP